MDIDSALATYDFKSAWDRDSDVSRKLEALHAFQMLVLDEPTCLARAEMLRRMGKFASMGLNTQIPDRNGQADFSKEIELIVQMGTFAAIEQNLLSYERLTALSSDPDALIKTHNLLKGLIDQQINSDPAK